MVHVGATDTATYAGVVVMSFAIAALASLASSRRALKADPPRVLPG